MEMAYTTTRVAWEALPTSTSNFGEKYFKTDKENDAGGIILSLINPLEKCNVPGTGVGVKALG